MTAAEIEIKKLEKMDTLTITPAMAAKVLAADPHSIRMQARYHPERLGFPTVCCGNRVKILREPFVRFVKYGKV